MNAETSVFVALASYETNVEAVSPAGEYAELGRTVRVQVELSELLGGECRSQSLESDAPCIMLSSWPLFA